MATRFFENDGFMLRSDTFFVGSLVFVRTVLNALAFDAEATESMAYPREDVVLLEFLLHYMGRGWEVATPSVASRASTAFVAHIGR